MGAFFVGVCRVDLSLQDNFSLKGKRSVVRRVIARTRNQHNIAMAEVGDNNDVLTRATIGFSIVGNDKRFVNSCIDTVLNFIEEMGEAPIIDSTFEIEQYG
ncbi:MAG: hypothetical protein ACI9OJ_000552 [Myxococcota bacterium]